MGAQQSYTLADVRQRAVDAPATEPPPADAADYAVQGVRLGLPAGNSSQNVVEANIDSMPADKLIEHLRGLGVPPAPGLPDDDLRAMLKLAVRSDFWRRVWQQHPNKGLLRMWMYAHEGFRRRLVAMRQAATPGTADLTAGQVTDIGAQVQAFVKKNAPHSEFEETQVFPFFKEAYPQFDQFWREIDSQHASYDELVKKLTSAIEAAGAAADGSGEAAEARKSVAAGVAELASFYEAHLLLEERLLLPLWLNLDEAQKADLRSRLRGMYWLSSYSF